MSTPAPPPQTKTKHISTAYTARLMLRALRKIGTHRLRCKKRPSHESWKTLNATRSGPRSSYRRSCGVVTVGRAHETVTGDDEDGEGTTTTATAAMATVSAMMRLEAMRVSTGDRARLRYRLLRALQRCDIIRKKLFLVVRQGHEMMMIVEPCCKSGGFRSGPVPDKQMCTRACWFFPAKRAASPLAAHPSRYRASCGIEHAIR